MRILVVEPMRAPYEKEMAPSLTEMQAVVGGTIQAIYPFEEPVALICNDEAKLLGMEGNRRLDSGSIIAGPFFVIGEAGENFRSLTDAEVSRYLQVYAEPHQISQREVQADMGFTFYCF